MEIKLTTYLWKASLGNGGPKKTLIEWHFPSNSVWIAGKIHVCTLNLYGACMHDRVKKKKKREGLLSSANEYWTRCDADTCPYHNRSSDHWSLDISCSLFFIPMHWILFKYYNKWFEICERGKTNSKAEKKKRKRKYKLQKKRALKGKYIL